MRWGRPVMGPEHNCLEGTRQSESQTGREAAAGLQCDAIDCGARSAFPACCRCLPPREPHATPTLQRRWELRLMQMCWTWCRCVMLLLTQGRRWLHARLHPSAACVCTLSDLKRQQHAAGGE